jgi:hypothetical protein
MPHPTQHSLRLVYFKHVTIHGTYLQLMEVTENYNSSKYIVIH